MGKTYRRVKVPSLNSESSARSGVPSTLGKPVDRTLGRGWAGSRSVICPWLRGLPYSRTVSVTWARSALGRMRSRDGVLAIWTVAVASSACPTEPQSSQAQTKQALDTRETAACRRYAMAALNGTAKSPSHDGVHGRNHGWLEHC